MAHQEDKQLELARRQSDRSRVETGLARHHVHVQVAVGETSRTRGQRARQRASRASQDCLDAGGQLARGEGFGHVVVGSKLQADDPVDLVPLGGKHDDRYRGEGTESPADLQPIDAREHQIQHHEIGRVGEGTVEGLLAIAQGLHLTALAFEIAAHDLGDVGIVIHDKHSRLRDHPIRVRRRAPIIAQVLLTKHETSEQARFHWPGRVLSVDTVDVLVMAKEPVAGRVKTRLCPPCLPEEAAALAEAALIDTLAAALGSAAGEVVLALDGGPGEWLPPGVRIIPQCGGPFGERLVHAWQHMSGPAVQIAMDTPQITATDLDHAFEALSQPTVEAVLGPADDGGWWLIGLRHARPEIFHGVPTSRSDTGARQYERLQHLGLRVEMLGPRRDVDTIDDARVVASEAPRTRFAAAFRRLHVGR